MSLGIPVLYYHSIGRHHRTRPKSFLTLSPELLERQIQYLISKGFEFVTLDEVYEYVSGNRKMTRPEIVLTFDDGYLDNWQVVFPLAKKYGFKYTIVVNPDFVHPENVVRSLMSFDEIKEKDWSRKDWWGYLSWAEMKEMESSGLVDIQSHALTHTWYPVSEEIIDFHHPGDKYHWLDWNEYPDDKPFFLTKYEEDRIPYGTPIYNFKKSLQARRFFPKKEIGNLTAKYVAENGGVQFFSKTTWRNELKEVVKNSNLELEGKLESLEEQKERLRKELLGSKQKIEKALEKEVNYLCYPGGSESELAKQIAFEVGYKATTKGRQLNLPGNNPKHIHRISAWLDGNFPEWMKWNFFTGNIARAQGKKTLKATMISTARKILIE